MNKVLVKVIFPIIDCQYDVWIPINKSIYDVITLLIKGINEIKNDIYQPEKVSILYNRLTGNYYDLDMIVQDTDIKNGTELILI